MSTLRVVFMGTPEFAVPSLAAIHQMVGVQVVGVVTAPDKPAGRGYGLQHSPIKMYAQANQLPVLQPMNLKDAGFIAELAALQADVQVVVAFRMLPEMVFAMPALGSINLHASLLPDYRGAAPIHWAVINGEKETGLTTFFIRHAIDTGNIIQQVKLPIPDHYTTGMLHDVMMHAGAQLLVRTLLGLQLGSVATTSQDDTLARHSAPKIFKDTAHINWNRPAEELYHFIRGMAPHPAAWALLDGQVFKIYMAVRTHQLVPNGVQPGTLQVHQGQLLAACADAWLALAEVQLAGRKLLTGNQFAIGYLVNDKALN